jgi:hypothetical protein
VNIGGFQNGRSLGEITGRDTANGESKTLFDFKKILNQSF